MMNSDEKSASTSSPAHLSPSTSQSNGSVSLVSQLSVTSISKLTSCRTVPARSPTSPSRWRALGVQALKGGMYVSDKFGGVANGIAGRVGSERFWPVQGDFDEEIKKCERILRAFTSQEGTELSGPVNAPNPGGKERESKVVRRRIPSSVWAQAMGVAIYTSCRTGIAPLGGSGGSGCVLAKLPDGSWSAPSGILPNNLAVGAMLGLDIFDVVLILRSQKALDSFASHKFTLGSDIAVAAGPFGVGAMVEAGMERAPIWSYVRSRGFYAGITLLGQVFVDRFDENERFYARDGIKAGDILTGKTRVPHEVKGLHQALRDAEFGPGFPTLEEMKLFQPRDLDAERASAELSRMKFAPPPRRKPLNGSTAKTASHQRHHPEQNTSQDLSSMVVMSESIGDLKKVKIDSPEHSPSLAPPPPTLPPRRQSLHIDDPTADNDDMGNVSIDSLHISLSEKDLHQVSKQEPVEPVEPVTQIAETIKSVLQEPTNEEPSTSAKIPS